MHESQHHETDREGRSHRVEHTAYVTDSRMQSQGFAQDFDEESELIEVGQQEVFRRTANAVNQPVNLCSCCHSCDEHQQSPLHALWPCTVGVDRAHKVPNCILCEEQTPE